MIYGFLRVLGVFAVVRCLHFFVRFVIFVVDTVIPSLLRIPNSEP